MRARRACMSRNVIYISAAVTASASASCWLIEIELEIAGQRGKAQIDMGPRRRVAVFAVVVEAGNLDLRVGQADPQPGAQIAVEQSDVELQIIADQRASADETQQRRQHLGHRPAHRHVALAQLMDFDRLRVDGGGAAHRRVKRLAGQHARAADPDRRDGDDLVAVAVEAGGLAIDGDAFVRRAGLEQERVSGVLQAPAGEEARDHRNIARLKWRRISSLNCLTMRSASRSRSRSMPVSAPARGEPETRVELERHQIIEALRQFARERLVERAEFGEGGDALGGVGLAQAVFEAERAHAVNDGEYAALLEIDALAADQRVEQADGSRELVERAGEMGEPGGLAAHRGDQIGLDRLQQFGVAGDGLRVVEDRDVHVRILRRRRRPGGEVGAVGRRPSSTTADCAPSRRRDRAETPGLAAPR